MNDELQRCPNCGAYVMSGDDICPRCDAHLRQDAPRRPATPDLDDPDKTDVFVLPKAPQAAAIYAAADPAGDDLKATDIFEVPADTAGDATSPDAVTAGDAATSPAADRDIIADDAPTLPPDTPALTDVYPAAEVDAEPELEPAADQAPAGLPVLDVTDMPTMQMNDLRESPENLLDDDAPTPLAEETALPDVYPAAPALALEAELEPEPVDLTSDPPLTDVFPAASAAKVDAEPEPEPDDLASTQPGTGRVAEAKPPILNAETMPTMQMGDLRAEASAEDAMHVTVPSPGTPSSTSTPYVIPPAPYTPPPMPTPAPPAFITPPPVPYAAHAGHYAPQQPAAGIDPALAYVQQRVQAYRQGGYRVETHGQYEASLRYGKRLSVGTLILALVTLIGALWYLVILAVSGFTADTVYVVLENDGRVYEDGPGAAHIRRQRSRGGRRWSAFGLVIFFISLLLAIPLGLVAGVVLTQDRYQAALREAYPAVTLFEEQFSAADAYPDDVALVKDGAVVFSIAAVLTLIGLWGGLTLFVIGTVHASAYRVHVPPLPGWA